MIADDKYIYDMISPVFGSQGLERNDNLYESYNGGNHQELCEGLWYKTLNDIDCHPLLLASPTLKLENTDKL